jgi:cytochrome oxidase Cu insertion factor (SCO1/SenC/PrrC family)
MTKNYEINEKDIDSMLKFLKLNDPEHATPEMAIAILEHMQAAFHTMSHEDPETLDKIYQDLRAKNKSN